MGLKTSDFQLNKVEKNDSLRNIIAYVFLLLFAFFLSMSDICFPGNKSINYSDGSIYQYIGHLVINGKMPYLDAFDHKGILLYFINAVGCLINEKWGIWCIDFLFMVLILILSYMIYRLFLPIFTSVIACIIIYSDIANGHWVWNTPDFFALPFEVLSLYIISKRILSDSSLKTSDLVIIGLSVSCEFWLKQTVIFPTALVVLLEIINEVYHKKYIRIIKYLYTMLVSFLISSGLIIIYLFYKNALSDMVKDYFLFNITYAANDMDESAIEVFLTHINNTSFVLTVVLCIMYFVILKKNHIKINHEKNFVFCCILSIAIILMYLSFCGRIYRQYYLMIYPVLILLSGVILNRLLDIFIIYYKNNSLNFILRNGKALLCIGLSVILILNFWGLFCQCKYDNYTSIYRGKIKEDICDLCDNDDIIAIANPFDAGLYLETGHESATTYPYIQMLFYDDKEFINDYNNQLMLSRPKIIVSMALDKNNDFYNKPVLCEDLLNNYSLYKTIGDYVIYVENM